MILLVSLSIHLLLLMGVEQTHTHGGKLGSLNISPLNVASLSNFSSVQIATPSTSTSVENSKQASNQTIKKTPPIAPSLTRQPTPRHGRITSTQQKKLENRHKAEVTTQHLNHALSSSKSAPKSHENPHSQPEEPKPITPSKYSNQVGTKVDGSKPSSSASSAAHQAGQLGSQNEPAINTAPAFKSQPAPPVYPNSARRFGREGEVLVRVVLDAKGNKTNITVLHSSGYRSLDRSALAAVKKWQFIAYQRNGHPVPSQVTIPIRFSLG